MERVLPRKGLLIKANDDAYKHAQREFGLLGAAGTFEAVPVLQVGPEEYYRLPIPLMFKEYVEDVIRECGRERDPVLVQTAREGNSLTAFYAGSVDFLVEHLNSLDGIEGVESWTNLGE